MARRVSGRPPRPARASRTWACLASTSTTSPACSTRSRATTVARDPHANLLLYARNSADPRHERAVRVVEGAQRPASGGPAWQTLTTFLRVATQPRVFPEPLTAGSAVDQVEEWLGAPVAWVPVPTPRHGEVFLSLVRERRITGPLVSDAHLAALAIEHGVAIRSTDADFARFDGLTWTDPLR